MSTLDPVTAVPIDAASERQAWFQALCDTYEANPETTWDEFVENLTPAAEAAGVSPTVVTEFVQVMADSPAPLDAVAEMHQTGVDDLETAYAGAAVDTDAGTDAEAEADPRAWLAALHELGAHWDRDETNWPVFREWFRFETERRGLGAEGQAFVEYAEAGDKVAVFEQYQVPNPAQVAEPEIVAEPEPADELGAAPEPEPAPAVDEFPEVREGDSGDWVAYADELLTRAGY